jgi:3-hydroxyacyl-CoA dehydrogenase
MRNIFHGHTACKKNPYGKPEVNVQTLAILGAGLMGAGIAQATTPAPPPIAFRVSHAVCRGAPRASDASVCHVVSRAAPPSPHVVAVVVVHVPHVLMYLMSSYTSCSCSCLMSHVSVSYVSRVPTCRWPVVWQASATKGFRVLLKDRDSTGLAKGENYIANNLAKKLKKKRMTMYKHDSTLAQVVGLTDAHASWTRHFGNADLVIEAVFEELGVKHKVIEQMEAVVPAHCIIATNTSTLPIGDIAAKAKRPENIVGMHYFSPAELMPLLEVIPHEGTSKAVCAAAVDVGIRQVRDR